MIALFGIQSTSYTYAPHKIDLIPLAKELNRDIDFLENRIGTKSVFKYASESEILSDSARLFTQLMYDNLCELNSYTLLLFVGQVRLNTSIPPFSCILHDLFSLPEHCLCIDVGHGCSGYVVALDLAYKHFLATGLNAVIVTCDPYRSIVSDNDLSTSLLFSDALSISLVGSSQNNLISCFDHYSDTSKFSGISCFSGDSLTMNGRDVMSYVRSHVVPRIRDFHLNFIDNSHAPQTHIFPHHGSKAVVELVSASFPDQNVIWDTSFSGNTISSSIPILLSNSLESLPIDSTSILCGFGVGLSLSLCKLER